MIKQEGTKGDSSVWSCWSLNTEYLHRAQLYKYKLLDSVDTGHRHTDLSTYQPKATILIEFRSIKVLKDLRSSSPC